MPDFETRKRMAWLRNEIKRIQQLPILEFLEDHKQDLLADYWSELVELRGY